MADRMSTGHPIGVTAAEVAIHVRGRVDALVRTPGFESEEPNVWNLLRLFSCPILAQSSKAESLTRQHREVNG